MYSFIMQTYSFIFQVVLSIFERVMTLLDVEIMKDIVLAMLLHNEREYITHKSSFTEFHKFYKELCPFLNQPSYNCAASRGISVLQTHLVYLYFCCQGIFFSLFVFECFVCFNL